jgi:beta-N-acetylhexosaminidase
MRKFLCLSLCLLALKTKVSAQNHKQRWVDSVYNKLPEEEKIGQLFMVAAYSGGEKYNEGQIQTLINNRMIGGVIFMQGTPEAQAQLTNKYQTSSKVPLLIGMDAEWGLGMRLTGVKNFPRQMMLGATRSPALMEQMAMAIAYQCKRMGVHVNFAPVVDVNNNPDNPVINFRSFGENKELVVTLAKAYTKGLQDNGVMACLKHFPGHGDVNVDSHYDLPVINKSKAQLQATEFYPFQRLIDYGVQSVMIAHLSIPSLDPRKNVPSTLSKNIVTDLLQTQMRFKGLIFTDAMNMQGVTKYFPEGDADLQAFLAGNDVLLFSQDVPKAIAKIKEAIKKGSISPARLETSVKKILAAKYDAGLNNFKPIAAQNATADLNQYTELINENIAREAITLVRDENHILNKLNLNPNGNYTYIHIGEAHQDEKQNFHTLLNQSLPRLFVQQFGKQEAVSRIEAIVQSLNKYDGAIVGIHNLSLYPKNNYGLDDMQLALLTQLSKSNKTIFINFGNAYALKFICDARSSIVAYEENTGTQKAVRDVLLNRMTAKGRLPVTPCKQATTGALTNSSNSIIVTHNNTLHATTPIAKVDAVADNPNKTTEMPITEKPVAAQELIKNPTEIANLERFINNAIDKGVFPGCQIVAMKNGQVVYKNNFGRLSYGSNENPVTSNTLYDVASVTKVASTTLAVMKLYEEGKLNLNAALGTYLPFVKGTDKASLKINSILLHQAGLKAWIPFYKATLDSEGLPLPQIYGTAKTSVYDIPVASGMYMNKSYIDTVWQTIISSPLSPGKYVYSDLDFLFLQKVVESISGMPLDEYVDKHFYKPLGLNNTLFNPFEKRWQQRCAPTERDNYFRYQTIQGYVHDMGAAMLGGVAGHAGLFSNAEDLAIIMQMLLNKGIYRGKQYFKPETINYFTAYNSGISRRGYGFDKPEKRAGDGGPASDMVSKQAFGHQGFTGTCVWADPQTGIVFVFLSNRTFPSADNGQINKLGIRTIAQSYIYKALGYK